MKYLIRDREFIPPEVVRSIIMRGARHSRDGATFGRYTSWATLDRCDTYAVAAEKIAMWFKEPSYNPRRRRVVFFGGSPFAITPAGDTLHGLHAVRYWHDLHPA